MTSFDSAICREAAKRLEAEMNACLQNLASGSLPDHSEYVRWSARYRAQLDVVKMLQEVEESLKS